MLTVVFPLRCSAASAYRVARLEANLSFFNDYEDVECVVVDSGSGPRQAAHIVAACAPHPRARLVVDPHPEEPFAPGIVRNLGAEHARGDYLFFYDVDLCAGPELVPALRRWIAAEPDANDFLIVPCLYLTERATEHVSHRGTVDLAPFLASFLAGANHLVAHLAVSTSTVLVERRHFLRIGGNRPEYRGHGCEDFDLLHRLSSYQPHGKRPPDYRVDHKVPFVGDYRGFRAYFALRALPPLFDGTYTAHLWHPRPLMRPYHRARQANEARLLSLMARHDDGTAPCSPLTSAARPDDEPLPPLPAPWSDEGDTSAPPLERWLTRLMEEHGYTVDDHPGLFSWHADAVRPGGTARSKLRKLILHPHAFFADSKNPLFRVVSALLSRDAGR